MKLPIKGRTITLTCIEPSCKKTESVLLKDLIFFDEEMIALPDGWIYNTVRVTNEFGITESEEVFTCPNHAIRVTENYTYSWVVE